MFDIKYIIIVIFCTLVHFYVHIFSLAVKISPEYGFSLLEIMQPNDKLVEQSFLEQYTYILNSNFKIRFLSLTC